MESPWWDSFQPLDHWTCSQKSAEWTINNSHSLVHVTWTSDFSWMDSMQKLNPNIQRPMILCHPPNIKNQRNWFWLALVGITPVITALNMNPTSNYLSLWDPLCILWFMHQVGQEIYVASILTHNFIFIFINSGERLLCVGGEWKWMVIWNEFLSRFWSPEPSVCIACMALCLTNFSQ